MRRCLLRFLANAWKIKTESAQLRVIENSIRTGAVPYMQFLTPAATEDIGRDNGIDSFLPFCKIKKLPCRITPYIFGKPSYGVPSLWVKCGNLSRIDCLRYETCCRDARTVRRETIDWVLLPLLSNEPLSEYGMGLLYTTLDFLQRVDRVV